LSTVTVMALGLMVPRSRVAVPLGALPAADVAVTEALPTPMMVAVAPLLVRATTAES
jgi:hypothetical protein